MKIFVTGARGTLGSEVIARLVRAGHSVVGLVRSGSEVVTNAGVTLAAESFAGHFPQRGKLALIQGDLEQNAFGMRSELLAGLASVDLVIHSAALTSFGRPLDRYQAINVEGTERVLEWVQGLSRRVPLLHISTMYVCGERPGVFREHELERGQTFGSPYEHSKYLAEQRVHAAREAGLRASIARPAIIVGTSDTGAMRTFDTIYSVYRITSAGLVRTIPGDYGATLDIVPVDWVADGVVAAAENFERAEGRVLHLCSDQPLTLRDINDVCAEFPSFNVPRFVPGHVFSDYPMRGLEKRFYGEIISLYESYFRRQVAFVRGSTKEVFPLPPPSQGKELLRTAFRHAVSVGYFRRRAHAA